jgi:hypothetical protein
MAIIATIPALLNYMVGNAPVIPVNSTASAIAADDSLNTLTKTTICHIPPGDTGHVLMMINLVCIFLNAYIFFKFCHWSRRMLKINQGIFEPYSNNYHIWTHNPSIRLPPIGIFEDKAAVGANKTSASANTVVISSLPRDLSHETGEFELKVLMREIVWKVKGQKVKRKRLDLDKEAAMSLELRTFYRLMHLKQYSAWSKWRWYASVNKDANFCSVHIVWDCADRYKAIAQLQAEYREKSIELDIEKYKHVIMEVIVV